MYFFLLLCTIGVIIIRIRGKTDGSERQRLTDRTWIGNPIIFSTVSGFIVVRGILNDYLQGLAIIVVLAIGFVIFRLRFRGGDL
jgi:solute carrier family 7 (L-type amino acid transporter), member 6